MIYHYRLDRMSKITKTQLWQHLEKKKATGTLKHFTWEFNIEQLLWTRIWQLFMKLNIILPYDPAIFFLGIAQVK